MVIATTDGSPQSVTAMYRPTDGAGGRPTVELVAGFAPVSESEIVPLFRRRLRFLVHVFIVYYAVVGIVLRVVYTYTRGSAIENWVNAATLIACVGLVATVSSGRRMTLRQLRVVEFLLF